ncbi:GNAT family N-acetyltransferase [Salinicoccus roseus]|uniref:GNAT family N-acetyltransferase n=1 Tax=Salinicoccus roseus TaxID=45670 RepID=A0A0C2DIG8_9STAP|nr:GNAT family N-acetyltransferase [Salinicoccus roseus]KIH69773.1 GNAT family acetyltransferase [Salinicoccus roseus]MDB0579226.1 GNAT family N-acetyltransferase [Salinicoccus roseus]
MQHFGTQTLETERLVLRKLTLDDSEAMYNNWASDPEVTEYLTWPPHESVEATRQLIGHWMEEYEKDDFYQWAIVPKDLGEPVGTISVVDADDSVGMVHIGYCIGKEWWGKGYTTEAFERLISFFFEDVGLNRIESKHDVRNPGSGRVMEKCGLLYEGTKRQADHNNQGICDSALYAIIRSDYKA